MSNFWDAALSLNIQSAYIAWFYWDVPGAADACWVIRVRPVGRLDRALRFDQPSSTELVLCGNKKDDRAKRKWLWPFSHKYMTSFCPVLLYLRQKDKHFSCSLVQNTAFQSQCCHLSLENPGVCFYACGITCPHLPHVVSLRWRRPGSLFLQWRRLTPSPTSWCWRWRWGRRAGTSRRNDPASESSESDRCRCPGSRTDRWGRPPYRRGGKRAWPHDPLGPGRGWGKRK